MCKITNPFFAPCEVSVNVIVTEYDHTRGSDEDQSVSDVEIGMWM